MLSRRLNPCLIAFLGAALVVTSCATGEREDQARGDLFGWERPRVGIHARVTCVELPAFADESNAAFAITDNETDPDLLLWYRFDETGGLTAADSSGNAND